MIDYEEGDYRYQTDKDDAAPDPCDRCDGEDADCVNCQWVRKWLSERT